MKNNIAVGQKKGKIGIYFLKEIWLTYTQMGSPQQPEEPIAWNLFYGVCNALGIGLEPTLKYLLQQRPSFEEFEDWILANGWVSPEITQYFNTIVDQEFVTENEAEAAILSASDLEHWDQEGYLVLKNAVAAEDCEQTVSLIYDTIEADPADPRSWYKAHPLRQGIMIQLFNAPILNKNRFSSRIRLAFEQLWKRRDLMVSNDRVSFNPPETNSYQFQGPNLHWDVSLKTPIPFGVQGLLYLSDTAEDQGAFTLIPGFHNIIENWLSGLDPKLNPRDEKLLKGFEARAIAGKAGDLIIWHHSLPHGSSPNRSTQPRIVQYINYQPLDLEQQNEWI